MTTRKLIAHLHIPWWDPVTIDSPKRVAKVGIFVRRFQLWRMNLSKMTLYSKKSDPYQAKMS
jgi:hypothetical protein